MEKQRKNPKKNSKKTDEALSIQTNWVVEKQNRLNRAEVKLSLQESRIVAVYMSKINSRDPATRNVRFSVKDFKRIFGINGSLDPNYMEKIVSDLFRREILIHNEVTGGILRLHLFKSCYTCKMNGELIVEFAATDEAVKLFFFAANNKDTRYFSYCLQNVTKLKSIYAFRLYEVLKEHEWKHSSIELTIEDLRALLGVSLDTYTQWRDFKKRVLDPSIDAVNQTTDILCSYQRGKAGPRGAWNTIIFEIEPNPSLPVDASHLLTPPKEDSTEAPGRTGAEPDAPANAPPTQYPDFVYEMEELCDKRFSLSELQVIYDLIIAKNNDTGTAADLDRSNMFLQTYHLFLSRCKSKGISNEFSYFSKMFSEP